MTPRHVDLTVVQIGTNDANAVGYNNTIGVTLQQYEKNLRSIVESVLKFSKQLLLSCPPPVKQSAEQDKKVGQVIEIIQRVAKQFGLPTVDVRTKLQPGDNIWSDGLHLNALGNRKMFEVLSEHLDNTNVCKSK